MNNSELDEEVPLHGKRQADKGNMDFFHASGRIKASRLDYEEGSSNWEDYLDRTIAWDGSLNHSDCDNALFAPPLTPPTDNSDGRVTIPPISPFLLPDSHDELALVLHYPDHNLQPQPQRSYSNHPFAYTVDEPRSPSGGESSATDTTGSHASTHSGTLVDEELLLLSPPTTLVDPPPVVTLQRATKENKKLMHSQGHTKDLINRLEQDSRLHTQRGHIQFVIDLITKESRRLSNYLRVNTTMIKDDLLFEMYRNIRTFLCKYAVGPTGGEMSIAFDYKGTPNIFTPDLRGQGQPTRYNLPTCALINEFFDHYILIPIIRITDGHRINFDSFSSLDA